MQGPLSVLRPEGDGSIFIPAIDFLLGTTASGQGTRAWAGTANTNTPNQGQISLLALAAATTYFTTWLNPYALFAKVGTDPAVSDTYGQGSSSAGLAALSGSQLPGGGKSAQYYSVAHAVRGIVITGLTLLYRTNTGTAASITPTFYRTAFAGGAVLPAPSNPLGAAMTGTPPVSASANVIAFAMTFPVTPTPPAAIYDGLSNGFLVGNNNALTQDSLEVVFSTVATAAIDFFGVVLSCGYTLL